jgi:hypothetical protein
LLVVRQVAQNAVNQFLAGVGMIVHARLISLPRIVVFSDARQHFCGLLRIFLEPDPQSSAASGDRRDVFRRGFCVRGANATVELSGNSVMDYGKAHFK